MNKKQALALPVVFCYPPNCAPGEQAFQEAKEKEERLYRELRHVGVDRVCAQYESSAFTLADLNRECTWRNVYIGTALETNTVRKDRWGGWDLFSTKQEGVYQSPIGPGIERGGRFFIEHWVLCDSLTAEQVAAWNAHERIVRAESKARGGGKRAAQIELF